MRPDRNTAALDRFRLLAAVLVVANHTSPLASLTALGDFWLTRVLARLAVPFFLMCSGYFLARGAWRGAGRFFKRCCLLYGSCVLLYLPLNLYQGAGFLTLLKRLFTDGTFYHLWYFPAVLLGVFLARQLTRLGMRQALVLAGLLYLLGLGGDSYYGLVSQIPLLRDGYAGLFQLFSHTRNGLFFTPLFLLLGAVGWTCSPRTAAAGFGAALLAMSAEGLWLHGLGLQRHDSMYLALPLCMVFLFSWLLGQNGGEDRALRTCSTLVFILHPWCIVLVRVGAGVLGLEGLFIQNSLGHFCAVLGLSLALAWGLFVLCPRPLRSDARAWRELDLSALCHNVRVLRGTLSPGGELMAVLKADAYGHGAVPVARQLRRLGIRAFAVACLQEGIALRKAGIRGVILILGYTPPEDAALLRRWRLTQAVADAGHGRALADQGIPLHVHLALDTGMRRLGIPSEDRTAIGELYGLPSLHIDGVFSHLCVADSLEPEDVDATQAQLAAFYGAVHWMESVGLDPGSIHIQASYGLWNLPAQPCRYARAGIALYGVRSDHGAVRRLLDLRPALSLRARVATVRLLHSGECAGYGRAFQAERETHLAVVAIGYGDGLPRDLPQRDGAVLLQGRRCPMVGRMCMDQLLVDVTDLAEVRPGEVATLIGRDGEGELPVEELAAQCGTIANELLSHLGRRLGLKVLRP